MMIEKADSGGKLSRAPEVLFCTQRAFPPYHLHCWLLLSYTELLSWSNFVAAHASTPMLPIGLSQCRVTGIMVSLCIAIAK